MKVMATWSAKFGCIPECIRRFLAGQGAPGAGVTLLGRWHATDLSMGFSLFESNDPAALYASAAQWADVLDLKNVLVIEDADVGPILASLGKQ
ncbi:MAG TPA: DUF3303 family protein [Terracidiphilus sp.]|jgi:hypothetical protein